jgi:hypothetical protein
VESEKEVMSQVYRINSIHYDGVPTDRFAAKLSTLTSYGDTTAAAIIAYGKEVSAKPISVFRFPDGEYIVYEPI